MNTPTILLSSLLALAAPALGASAESAVERSVGEDPVAAALDDPDPFARVSRLASLLPERGRAGLPAVRRALEHYVDMGMAEFELLLRAWVRQEPLEATRWALSVRLPPYRISALDAAVEVWAGLDPHEAVAQLTRSAQSFEREMAQTVQLALVRGWFHSDHPGLESYIEGLGSGMQQQRSILAYALELQRSEGSEAVMRWADAVPDDDTRYKRAVFRQVTTALSWVDPRASERWCDARCEGPYGKSLRTAIVRVRINSEEDAGAILEWVGRAPAGESRDHALSTGFSMWARREREAALAWMQEKIAAGPEPWVETLYGTYALQLAAVSLEDAIRWAERVEYAPAREELLVRIARRWLREDPEAAETWLEDSMLSPDARRRARNQKAPDYLPRAGSG